MFLVWGAWVGVAFFGVYPTMNWLTSLRSNVNSLFFAEELRVPFVPEFIWVYLSMYVLFFAPPFFLEPIELRRLGRELISATIIAGIIFLLFPAQLGFERVLPEDVFYRDLFRGLFTVDHPYNLVPSLHVVYSTAICASIFCRAGIALRVFLVIWLLLLMASTVLVHQHHLADVLGGVFLAVLVRLFWEEKNVQEDGADGDARLFRSIEFWRRS